MAAVYTLGVKYYNGRIDPMNSYGIFDDEDAAFDALNELMANELHMLSETRTYDYTVVELEWKARERHHFDTGRYKHLPWAAERWWTHLRHAHITHFPHISVDDPTMLAYTEDEAKGEADRQTRIKPGKYLQKYFGAGKTGFVGHGYYKGHSPLLTPQQIAYYAEWFEQGQKPRKYKHLELRFAKTPEEIVDVYIRGPRSCMGNTHFNDPSQHPVQVYGAGDLQLAYLVDPTTDKVRARGLCYPEKSGFGRIYPAPENYASDGFASSEDATDCQNELRQRLTEMGWADVYKQDDVLVGARILKIPYPDGGPYYFRMPYLDVGYTIEDHEDGQHFKMSLGGVWQGGTGGYANCVPMFRCAHCASTHQQFDGSGRDLSVTVYHAYSVKDGPSDPQLYCNYCSRDVAYFCDGTQQRYRMNKVRRVRTGDDHSYVASWARANGMYKCAYDENNYLPTTQPKYEVGGQTYAECNLRRVAFWCRYDQTLYPISEQSVIYAGMPAKYDEQEISQVDREASDITRRVQVYDIDAAGWKTVAGDPASPIDNQTLAVVHFVRAHRRWQADQERQARINQLAAEQAAAETVNEMVGEIIAEPIRQVA